MLLSLAGIVFGVAFFVVTQAQTSGFEKFFIRTVLGTNGAIRISDQFQDTFGKVEKVKKDGSTEFFFHSREDALYREGVKQPGLIREALAEFPEILGASKYWKEMECSILDREKNPLNSMESVGSITCRHLISPSS